MDEIANKLSCEDRVVRKAKQYLSSLESIASRQGGKRDFLPVNTHCCKEIACLDLASQE